MKKTLSLAILIAVAISLASCGATKRFKHTEDHSASFKTESNYDSTSQSKTKVENATNTKAKIKTTETVDTNITVPGTSVTGGKSLDDIKDGKPLVIDVNGHSLSVRYNPGTGNIEAKSTTEDRTVPVRATRVTEAETQEQSTTTAQEETKVSVSAENASKGESSSSELTKASETAATPWYFAPWPWIILFVVGAAAYLKYGSPMRWIAALIKPKPKDPPRDNYSL